MNVYCISLDLASAFSATPLYQIQLLKRDLNAFMASSGTQPNGSQLIILAIHSIRCSCKPAVNHPHCPAFIATVQY